jgi:hypothetical protein
VRISGYMTCRNASQMGYPFIEALTSLDNFCEEIVVCDTSDGSDNTTELLEQFKWSYMFRSDKNMEVKIIRPEDIDWSAPNHGIYDGMTKAIARESCTGDYCFQIDADEIVDTTWAQVKEMIEASGMNEENPLMALPVVEYWGSEGKVRVDVNPWKWRLSLNLPHITHGIPAQARQMINGLLYARHGTDGCDYISKHDFSIIPCINFVKPKVEQVRQMSVSDQTYVPTYEAWFNKTTDKMPTIYHYSWWSVYEKMLKYKLFWNNSWMSLYNEERPPGYNPFFNKSFEDVTEEEMLEVARQIESETGGHIFHSPWDGQKTNHVEIKKDPPEIIKAWAEKHKTPKK